VLTLSNGGPLPHVNSLEYLAAAVKRQAAWHVLGPVAGDTLDEDEPGYQPFRPLALGSPLEAVLAEAGVDVARLPVPGLTPSAFIVVGPGYFDPDGYYCDNREDPGPLHAVGQPQYSVSVIARDVDAFVRGQPLVPKCETPAYLPWMQATLRASE
jgi:hypothetical protein